MDANGDRIGSSHRDASRVYVLGNESEGISPEVAALAAGSPQLELHVAEGALDEDIIRKLSPVTDFFGIGDEIWRAEDPAARLGEFRAAF